MAIMNIDQAIDILGVRDLLATAREVGSDEVVEILSKLERILSEAPFVAKGSAGCTSTQPETSWLTGSDPGCCSKSTQPAGIEPSKSTSQKDADGLRVSSTSNESASTSEPITPDAGSQRTQFSSLSSTPESVSGTATPLASAPAKPSTTTSGPASDRVRCHDITNQLCKWLKRNGGDDFLAEEDIQAGEDRSKSVNGQPRYRIKPAWAMTRIAEELERRGVSIAGSCVNDVKWMLEYRLNATASCANESLKRSGEVDDGTKAHDRFNYVVCGVYNILRRLPRPKNGRQTASCARNNKVTSYVPGGTSMSNDTKQSADQSAPIWSYKTELGLIMRLLAVPNDIRSKSEECSKGLRQLLTFLVAEVDERYVSDECRYPKFEETAKDPIVGDWLHRMSDNDGILEMAEVLRRHKTPVDADFQEAMKELLRVHSFVNDWYHNYPCPEKSKLVQDNYRRFCFHEMLRKVVWIIQCLPLKKPGVEYDF